MVILLNNEVLKKSTKPIIVKAFTTWCPHCTKMKPIFEELEEDLGDKYIFAEFDTDSSPELAAQFNIEALPTFIFIKNNKELGRAFGQMPLEELKNYIKRSLD